LVKIYKTLYYIVMNLKRLISTPLGIVFISLLLGLGLATLFRKVCNDKNCIIFNGPIISEFDKKIYQYGSNCYQYDTAATNCDKMKKIIDITGPISSDPAAELQGTESTILTGASPVNSSSPPPSLFNVFRK